MANKLLIVVAVAIAATASPPQASSQIAAAPYSIIIAGGTILDGSGAPGIQADLGITADRITAISTTPLPRTATTRVIDATGMYVTPGFIDVHAHIEPILSMPDAESHIRQGVTLALGGPDGSSPLPIGETLRELEVLGVGLNVAYTVGHNTVRRDVMGNENRLATQAELGDMRQLVAEAMGEGAWGISTGLIYLPGTFANIEEVIALSTVAADSGGFYTSHMRDEGLGLFASVQETIEIGRRARLPVVLSHHKAVGLPMWGKSVETLEMVDRARAEGIDVRIDQYPYTATLTGISILVPEWAQAGGEGEFLARLADPVLHDSIHNEIVFNIINDRGGNDLRRVQFSGVTWDASLEGKTLYDWAVREGLEPTPENGARLVIEAMRRGGMRTIYHALEEDDVRRIMQHPQTMIASDGRLNRLGEDHPHPRAYGTFPRVLGMYTRDAGVLTWPVAIQKMTSMPAGLLGVRDRGVLREGAFADVVIFDPETVVDKSTFQEPHQYPVGIDYVIVNGEVTLDDGVYQDVRAGRVLRRNVDGGAPRTGTP